MGGGGVPKLVAFGKLQKHKICVVQAHMTGWGVCVCVSLVMITVRTRVRIKMVQW